MCNGAKEDLVHFLFLCPALNNIRRRVLSTLEKELKHCGAEEVWYQYCASSVLGKLCLFLGDYGYMYSNDVGAIFDTLSKEFLVKAWSFRQESLADPPEPTT